MPALSKHQLETMQMIKWKPTNKSLRRCLINSGVETKSIRIRDTKLFVDNQLYGEASGSSFVQASLSQSGSANPTPEGGSPNLSPKGGSSNPSPEGGSSPQDWLQVCLFNAQSLANQLLNFQSFVYMSSYLILAVTETWLSPHILVNEILPSSFCIYRRDRPTRGGGVLLAIHRSVPAILVPSPPYLELVIVISC